MPADSRPEILLVSRLPAVTREALGQHFVCHDAANANHRKALIDAVAPRIRGAVMFGAEAIEQALLERLPRLEILACFGVGYDGVPLEYCRARGLRVSNTPEVLTDDTADIAVALVLMLARDLLHANRHLHGGQWLAGPPPLATCLRGKRIGIFGLGRIGKAIAYRLEAFGCVIAYHGRERQAVDYHYHPDLEVMARESDFLVVACPGGEATRNRVDRKVLHALGSKGWLVNIARGSVVDETALIEALEKGAIRGAGLDVYVSEPAVDPRLLAAPNVVLLPHVGSATRETRQAMGELMLQNLLAHFAGRPLPTPV